MSQSAKSEPVWLVLTVLVLAELTCAFEASMIYAALSGLHRLYGDPVRVGWLITGFLLVSAGAAAICGRLGDLYGRRTVLLYVLGLAALGSFISLVATDLGWIIAGRAVQGVSAAILPLCFGLARERLPADRVAFAIGVVAGTAMFGAALGYGAGGFLVDNFHWQSIFKVSFALALVSMVAVAWKLSPLTVAAPTQALDLLGGVLFVPGITGLVFAVSRGREWGWTDARMLGLLALSALILGWWVRHELRQKQPLIDVRLLANRQIGLANLCFFLAAFGSFQSQMILLPLLQQPTWTLVGLGISATLAGSLKGGMGLVGMVTSPWAGSLCGRWGGRHVLMLGAGMLALAWVVMVLRHDSVALVLTINFFLVLGMTFVYTAVPSLVVEAAPSDRVSEATGISSVLRAVAGALGSQAIAYALSTSTVSDPTQGPGRFPTEAAYSSAFTLVAASAALCLIAAWLLPRRTVAPDAAKATPHGARA